MDEEQKIWAIYFAGIASLRFHPRNIMLPLGDFKAEESALVYSAFIADLMLALHKERFKCPGS